MNKVVFTITGPTCGGKSSLEKHLVNEEGFAKVISTTTRQQRPEEKDGESYYFVNPTRFVAMAEGGEMVEHVEFGGNFYGASKAEFERGFAEGKPVVVVCEPLGRRQIEAFAKKEGWTLLRVFVDAPTEVQAARFLERFADEVTFASTSLKAMKVSNYTKRLTEIMTTERGWISEAYAHDIDDVESAYDVLISRFDEETADDIVIALAELALLNMQKETITDARYYAGEVAA